MTDDGRPHEGVELFRDLGPGRPPAQLRARALGAAIEALATEPDVWTRLWYSRPLRLGWVAATALLVAGHLAIAPPTRTTVEPTEADTVLSVAAFDGELAEIVRLPRIDQAILADLR